MMVSAREADERLSRFLYAGDDMATSVIKEYLIHMAPSGDYSGDERAEAAKKPPGDEHEEQRHIRPHFLNPEEKNGPRVVEFYSPWCGHCQKFKPRYIELAKQVKSRSSATVEFFAVSCSAHHWVCNDNNVTGYPTVKAFKANSVDAQIIKRFIPEIIAQAVGVALDNDQEKKTSDNAGPKRQQQQQSQNTRGSRDSIGSIADFSSDRESSASRDSYLVEDTHDNARPHIDILGASMDGYTRTKNDVYNDATLSFMYALKSDIFPQSYKDQPLSPEQKSAFVEWIDLLYWTLPPTWRLHTLINDIRSNIDTAVSSQSQLSNLVDVHRDVVMLDSVHEWSKLCQHGKIGAGYTCGLWSLFHIVSVGVKERYKAVLGARDRVSTAHAAETLKNYISNFMGHCSVCQERFLEMYDECGFQHCTRFDQMGVKRGRRRTNVPPPPETWEEFSLWLWEVHNDVNQQLVMEEVAMKGDGRMATDEELESILWPTVDACPECWDEGGSWDRDSILQHLTREYWPGGVHNFRFVVLDKKAPDEKIPTRNIELSFGRIVVFGCGSMLLAWFMKKRHLAITGRHKKFEGDYVDF